MVEHQRFNLEPVTISNGNSNVATEMVEHQRFNLQPATISNGNSKKTTAMVEHQRFKLQPGAHAPRRKHHTHTHTQNTHTQNTKTHAQTERQRGTHTHARTLTHTHTYMAIRTHNQTSKKEKKRYGLITNHLSDVFPLQKFHSPRKVTRFLSVTISYYQLLSVTAEHTGSSNPSVQRGVGMDPKHQDIISHYRLLSDTVS